MPVDLPGLIAAHARWIEQRRREEDARLALLLEAIALYSPQTDEDRQQADGWKDEETKS
jgi:hypothetical protein